MPLHNFTHSNDTALGLLNHASVQFFPCLTLSWHTLIIFRIYFIETKLDFVSFDGKNLQRRCEFAGEGEPVFLIQNSYESGSMSESQQGPEISDVISSKR